MIVQEFQKSVLTSGEVSIMIFGGKYSHAVLKKSKKMIFVYKMILGALYVNTNQKKMKLILLKK